MYLRGEQHISAAVLDRDFIARKAEDGGVGFQLREKAHMFSRRAAIVSKRKRYCHAGGVGGYVRGIAKGLHIRDSYPRPLFLMHILDTCIQRCLALPFTRLDATLSHLLRHVHGAGHPIDVSDGLPCLVRSGGPTPPHLVELPLHSIQLGAINSGLPYSYPNRAESRDHQGTRKPRKLLVRSHLRPGKFMLLILASLAGCLLLFHRPIKNNSIPFLVVGGCYVILPLIGQFCVYLLFKRTCRL